MPCYDMTWHAILLCSPLPNLFHFFLLTFSLPSFLSFLLSLPTCSFFHYLFFVSLSNSPSPPPLPLHHSSHLTLPLTPLFPYSHPFSLYLDPPTSPLFKRARSTTDTGIRGGYVRSRTCTCACACACTHFTYSKCFAFFLYFRNL